MIYADHNATAPLLAEVIDYLAERLRHGPLANPNALHSLGRKVHAGMEHCRGVAARVLGARSDQVVFNSGASEGISTVFHHFLNQGPGTRRIILTSLLEHKAVASAAHFYEKKGYTVENLPVTREGIVAPETLGEALKQRRDTVALVALMAANNETGVVQPFESYAALCRKYGAPYFCDTCQWIGKSDFRFGESSLDFAVASGHKLGALPGSGLLLVKQPLKFTPLVFGADQENGLRGGTQNYIGNETLAVALEHFENHRDQLPAMTLARVEFEKQLKVNFPAVQIAGENVARLPGTTMVAYPGIHGQAVQIELESREIYVTTSSACSDNEPRTSAVLATMGFPDEVGRGMIRISVGFDNFRENYQQIQDALRKSYQSLARIESY